ncbi:MAG: dihydrolipoyl dehydrogenase [Actinobacteria bacterium]|nr:dihydrolipoyl dehydrogenase [Actinomycetota bacterium]
MSADLDCVVIGAGPGGYVAALRATQLGLRTAVVEREQLGGRCLNVACIPAKAVLRAADLLDEARAAPGYGILTGGEDVGVDFDAVAGRRDAVIAKLTGGVAGLLSRHGVEVITGEARLVPGGVRVGERTLIAPATIVAAGSRGTGLPGIEFGGRVIGTEEAWAFDELPGSIAVAGAGPSGVELASAYARLGSEVTLVEVAETVLPGEDADVVRPLERALKAQSVELLTGAGIEAVEADEAGVAFVVAGRRHAADWLVLATGREPDVAALGLDQLGVRRDQAGLLAVDDEQRTSVAGVFAIGDLVAGPALAHKSSEEGIVAAEAAAGGVTLPVGRELIPRVTFASPAVAAVGLTEAAARAAGHEIAVGKVPFAAVGAGTLLDDRGGLVKIVAESGSGQILGAHVVGSRAPELLQQIVDTQALQGGVGDLARIVHGHPTLSEAVGEAARAADGWLIHG